MNWHSYTLSSTIFEQILEWSLSCYEQPSLNNLMTASSYAFNYFEKRVPKSFKNAYMFKRWSSIEHIS